MASRTTTDGELPFTPEEVFQMCDQVARRLRDHQRVNEMLLAVAQMREQDGSPNDSQDVGLWPGVAVVMDLLSRDSDEILSQLDNARHRARRIIDTPKGGMR